MIDPISFVALAGNAIQFVEVGSKLVSTFSQLYQSGNGTIAERAELETVIDDLLLLNNMLLTTPGIGKTDPIRRLCEACNEVTRDLLIELERMKVKRKHRFWDALFKALKSSWNEKKIVNLEQRVAILRDELSFHLIVGLRQHLLCLRPDEPRRFEDTDHTVQKFIDAFTKQQHIFHTVLESRARNV